MKNRLHSVNETWHVESDGKNGKKQYRLTGQFSGQKTIFGHKVESQAGKIDMCILQGRFTVEEIARTVKFSTDKKAIARVNQHIKAKLVKIMNIDIQTDYAGRIYAADNDVSDKAHSLLISNEKAAAAEKAVAIVKHVRRQNGLKGHLAKMAKKA